MPLSKYLSEDRTLFLKGTSKYEVLREMVEATCRDLPKLELGPTLRELSKRESTASTRIASDVAFPHVRLYAFGDIAITVGRSLSGLKWDAEDEHAVHLVVLILSDDGHVDKHIHLLAELAQTLRDKEVKAAIKSATTSEELYHVLEHAKPRPILLKERE